MPPSVNNEVVENEDLAFLISSFLCNQTPSLNTCCLVSKRWNQSFGLVRAQLRWDYMHSICEDDNNEEWLYHKISYIPGGTTDQETGRLVLERSSSTQACIEASKLYRRNLNNDGNPQNRSDSRPEYFYEAYKEKIETLSFVPPRPLRWNDALPFHFVNEIDYDDKPRLVNKFLGQIGDVSGASNPLAASTSSEGEWDLGYHEISRVHSLVTSTLRKRPPLGGFGEDTTQFLRSVNARPSADARWIKLAHLRGEDRCRLFLKKNLLPLMGPRPTGDAWYSTS